MKAVLKRRTARREEFESIHGWRIVIEADRSSPLWPQGFDPLNVYLVEGGVLHSRFIKLGNENGNMEVMGMTALTEEIGPHPLFNGVRRILVTGFESEPSVMLEGDQVNVNSNGLKASFIGASVDRGDQEVLIRLIPPKKSGNEM